MLIRTLFRALLAITLISTWPAVARSAEAGFTQVTTPSGLEVGIWYPTVGAAKPDHLGLFEHDIIRDGPLPDTPRPTIVISHGTGGDYTNHLDTAVALARAGFIVAALTHPGDNWRDNSRAARLEERPSALRHLITFMTEGWSGRGAVDAERIGAFGFSSGGFTVLAAAGGRPDLARYQQHCADHPEYFDCRLRRDPGQQNEEWPDSADQRLKAIVVAAPAGGFTFGPEGLRAVTIPVQLWRADNDAILPAPFYADAVRDALQREPEFFGVPRAGHFDFLAPCPQPYQVPTLCESSPDFDRAAFHEKFNSEVVRFFKLHLFDGKSYR